MIFRNKLQSGLPYPHIRTEPNVRPISVTGSLWIKPHLLDMLSGKMRSPGRPMESPWPVKVEQLRTVEMQSWTGGSGMQRLPQCCLSAGAPPKASRADRCCPAPGGLWSLWPDPKYHTSTARSTITRGGRGHIEFLFKWTQKRTWISSLCY